MDNYTEILGYSIYNKNMERFLAEELNWEGQKVILSGNPEILSLGLKDRELFKQFTHKDTLIIPDGISMLVISKLRKLKMQEKLAGIEVLKEVIRLADKDGKSVYIYGAEKEVLEKAVVNIKTEFPNLNIIGYKDGYIKDRESVAKDIERCKPDLLVTALGCPAQEEFLYNNKNRFGYKIGMGVGGSIDGIGGKVKRAPRWMIKIGMEWAYRVIKEPKRFKRLGVIPKFILKGLKEKRNYADER